MALQPIDNPTDAESRQYRITRNGVEFTISQDGDLWRVASSLGDIGFRYLTLFFAMQACSLTLKLGNVRHEYIVGWPIEAQQRAWVITVASSPSAVDSEEVQTLLSKWTAWGQLTTTEWEGMKSVGAICHQSTVRRRRDESEDGRVGTEIMVTVHPEYATLTSEGPTPCCQGGTGRRRLLCGAKAGRCPWRVPRTQRRHRGRMVRPPGRNRSERAGAK